MAIAVLHQTNELLYPVLALCEPIKSEL